VRIDWQLEETYDGIGGEGTVREAIEEALASLPREHLRQLDILSVQDTDPKGRSLGIWRQDHHGCAIEIYAEPHVAPLLSLPLSIRDFAVRLHLAYTLFHEVGHHVTRVLNPRATPPRKAPQVEAKIERWADQYAEKRLRHLYSMWLAPDGRADGLAFHRALRDAVHALRLEAVIDTESNGTKSQPPSSSHCKTFPAE